MQKVLLEKSGAGGEIRDLKFWQIFTDGWIGRKQLLEPENRKNLKTSSELALERLKIWRSLELQKKVSVETRRLQAVLWSFSSSTYMEIYICYLTSHKQDQGVILWKTEQKAPAPAPSTISTEKDRRITWFTRGVKYFTVR